MKQIIITNSVLSDVQMDVPFSKTRHSMGSRIPEPNNLQSELEQATRRTLSSGGTRVPFRDNEHRFLGAIPRMNQSNSFAYINEEVLALMDSSTRPSLNQPLNPTSWSYPPDRATNAEESVPCEWRCRPTLGNYT